MTRTLGVLLLIPALAHLTAPGASAQYALGDYTFTSLLDASSTAQPTSVTSVVKTLPFFDSSTTVGNPPLNFVLTAVSVPQNGFTGGVAGIGFDTPLCVLTHTCDTTAFKGPATYNITINYLIQAIFTDHSFNDTSNPTGATSTTTNPIVGTITGTVKWEPIAHTLSFVLFNQMGIDSATITIISFKTTTKKSQTYTLNFSALMGSPGSLNMIQYQPSFSFPIGAYVTSSK